MALSFVSSLYIFNTLFSFSSLGALAAPISQQKRQSGFTTLSSTQISSFATFTHYASTAYCPSSQTLTWSCGANCDANPGFQPIASGGDGDSVQFWYVGVDPDLETVIVGHQGTDPKKLMPLLTDADFFLDNLDTTLFPGVSSDIKVHNGFADAHAETASDVLSAVQKALDQSGVNQVTVVGHSLGAAKALLEGVFLPLHLPDVQVKVIGYGMPRTGNQAFANYVDANLDVTHVNNKQDLVPILPGRFLGFAHASGETHIQNDESWVACPGQDNTNALCTVGDVKNILEGSIANHDGPYAGIKIGC